jgi:hypothetical protein
LHDTILACRRVGRSGWPLGVLADELSRLRKGRGVMAGDLADRVGPALRAVAGIEHNADQNGIRRKLISFLDEAAREMPEDLRLALSAGLALDEGQRSRFLEERMQWLAGKLQRDVRTARRRLDEACAQVEVWSATMPRAGGYAPDGWYLARFRAALSLDGSQPIAIEERTVVASTDGLSEVVISTSIPRSTGKPTEPHGIRLEVLSGGSLTRQEVVGQTYFRSFIELPRPLRVGESHELKVGVSIPADQPMNPRYSFQPVRRCDEFDLLIRFGLRRTPRRVWMMDGLPHGMLAHFADPDAVIAPDAKGDVQLRYVNLRGGLVYGACWEPAEA